MNNIETGGPAFPGEEDVNYPSMTATEKHIGMTLRDYFAAKAMQGLVASCTNDQELTLSLSAKWCYEMADAMLESRKM